MKTLLLSVFLLFLAMECIAQEGFEYIDKAEKKIKKGRIKRAEAFLEMATEADYTMYSDAAEIARDRILINRAKILAFQKEYIKAADLLNDSLTDYKHYDVDELKMCYYAKGHGRDAVQQEISELFEKLMEEEWYDYDDYAYLNTTFSKNKIKLCLNHVPVSLDHESEEEIRELEYARFKQ